MGSRYLLDLAEVCRGAGLAVVEVDGWQSRARGSGGYNPGQPDHVMIHHTASGPDSDGWPDVNYCTFGDDDAPLCNLYLDRQGVVYVCAAGATNTNGSGVDPCGVCPDDSMNSHAVGIEANGGTGTTWPALQLNAYLVLVAELGDAYGIPTACVHAHFEYAPTRKVDPSGPDRYATGTASWDMVEFRADLTHTEGDDMANSDEILRELQALRAEEADRYQVASDRYSDIAGRLADIAGDLDALAKAEADRYQVASSRYQSIMSELNTGGS